MRSLFIGQATRSSNLRGISDGFPKVFYLYNAMRLVRSVYPTETAEESLRKTFRRNPRMFEPNELEKQQFESLRRQGYAFAAGFFSRAVIDRIAGKANAVFKRLENCPNLVGEGSCGPEELSGQTIELKHCLMHISDILDLAFHESILKVAAHFLKQVPAMYRVALVRDFPGCGGEDGKFRQETGDLDSLKIVIDLGDVSEANGPFVYVPGSNLCGRYPAPGASSFQEPVGERVLEEREVDRVYPRNTWATLGGERGSVTFIHRRGLHKGPVWRHGDGLDKRPRTSIRIDVDGSYTSASPRASRNAMPRWNFERMNVLQQLFARPCFLEEPSSG